MSIASWLFLIALVLVGCDGPDPTGPPDPAPPDAGPTPCAPGEVTLDDGTCQPPAGLPPDMPCPPGELLLEDGITCQPAGLPPDMPCPPGEMLLDDGTCQKAGVPPSACGVGFLPDGKEGCEPILPADPCPEGLMAVPGDTVCHEVAPCGTGTWGDIPVEANTQFVNKSYAGGNSDGSQAKPWTTIQKGVNAAAKGAIVAVAAGSYPEDVLIQGKAVRLWGRCPAMVEVVGTGAKPGTIQVLQKAANGTEIHGVAVTGANVGIMASGTSDVGIEGVWLHGMGIYGLGVQDDLGPTSVVLKGSLVEQNHTAGVFVVGSDATIEATVVRSTLPNALGNGGRGIDIEDDYQTEARANVTVRTCLVEQNHQVGVFVAGSDATIEATVVRSTLPDAQEKFGHGINVQDTLTTKERANVTVRACLVEQNHEVGVIVAGSDATIETTVVRATSLDKQGKFGRGIDIVGDLETKKRANVTVRACLVEQNHSVGVFVAGSDAAIEATVVRATLPDEQGKFGRGIEISGSLDTKERANVTVRACLVEQNRDAGVLVASSDVRIEATAIRSTLPDAVGKSGRGISIQDDQEIEERANVTVHACLVEQSHEIGVFVQASDATIEATVIRATLPDAMGNGGRGINIQANSDMTKRANVTVRACLIEQSYDVGFFVSTSDIMIDASIVRDTAPRKSDNKFGDGISAMECNVTMQNVEVTHNARAGVSNFAGQVVITGGAITCNGFDLEGEPFANIPFSFDGSTGWQCSEKAPAECTELGDCHVETSGIEAPSELPPVDPLKP